MKTDIAKTALRFSIYSTITAAFAISTLQAGQRLTTLLIAARK